MSPPFEPTRRELGWLAALLGTTAIAGGAAAQPRHIDPLKEGFSNPPGSARPRVWWHWMNGNITRDGIEKDIQWMSRVGLGGLQNFDATQDTPQIVGQRLVYMSPAWKEAFRYAAALAEHNRLELAVAAAPGWSETGGPWVEPRDAMKKLVWSELVIEGERAFNGRLPSPPKVSGPFQAIPRAAEHSPAAPPAEYYEDIAVLAHRLAEPPLPTPSRVLVNGNPVEPKSLADADYQSGIEAPQGTVGAPTLVEVEFDQPHRVCSAELYIPGDIRGLVVPNVAWLEAQNASGGWDKLADVALAGVPTTVAFPAVTAKALRFVISPNPHPSPFAPPVPPPSFMIGRLSFSSERRVHRFETKAGYQLSAAYEGLDEGLPGEEVGLPANDIIDLTDRLTAAGDLDWVAPAGRWRVVRLGCSLTGATNHPATAEATGLEVDKFDRDAVRRYITTYLGLYADAAGADLFGRRGVRALLNDSTEVGPANWTRTLADEFRKRRGYNLLPWLLTATGVLVGSRKDSNGFLFDFRQTLAELHAEHHYAQIAETAHQSGLTVYGEAHEGLYGIVGDDMSMRRYTDIPMGALWTFPQGGRALMTHMMDCKGAASVANIYGKRAVAAEALTSFGPPFSDTPSSLKRVIDLAFALGINLPVIHTAVHQPVEDKRPGMSLGGVGQFFGRHETWAEMAAPWIDYMARSAFLLQQGRNVADVAYFYGEGSPIIARFGEAPPAGAPTLYAYDFINAEALGSLTVQGDRIVAPGGAQYRILFLGSDSRAMTLPTLRRIAALVEAGGAVAGHRPAYTPSLADDPDAFAKLCDDLWGPQVEGEPKRPRVLAAADADEALADLGLAADFASKAQNDPEVLFLHRKLEGGELYYLANRGLQEKAFEAAFRVTGKTPEIWRPDTGKTEPVSYRMEDGVTVVSLQMAPEDAFFVVFQKAAEQRSFTRPRSVRASVGAVVGPWQVSFEKGRGAPPSAEFADLESFSNHADPGIRYFSGEATYRAIFAAPSGLTRGSSLLIDLGQVADIAEIRLNGRLTGFAWKPPYQVEIGHALKPGKNSLEIKVANVWVNRLIGDAQPGMRRVAYTTFPTYTPDTPLRPAGLLGPVTFLAERPA